MSTQPLNRFVRSAWALLLFQLLAAFAAVAVTAWAAFQVRPLLEQRAALVDEIAAQQEQVDALEARAQTIESQNTALAAQLSITRQQARVEASQYVRAGINYLRAGDHARALQSYDDALSRDPDNAYTLDLKSYAQFLSNDNAGAITSIRAALAADPTYTFGYGVLALYGCSSQQWDVAREALDMAQAQGARDAVLERMRSDQQIARACAPLLMELGTLPRTPVAPPRPIENP